MKISYDDQYLITVSEDACLFIHKIVDKDGSGKRESDVPYAEEILITRYKKTNLNNIYCIMLPQIQELEFFLIIELLIFITHKHNNTFLRTLRNNKVKMEFTF